MSRKCISQSEIARFTGGNLLGEIIGSRKTLAAVRADVWSFLGMCPYVSKRPRNGSAAIRK